MLTKIDRIRLARAAGFTGTIDELDQQLTAPGLSTLNFPDRATYDAAVRAYRKAQNPAYYTELYQRRLARDPERVRRMRAEAARARFETDPKIFREKRNVRKRRALQRRRSKPRSSWHSEQAGLCYLCGDPIPAPDKGHTDHDHRCCTRKGRSCDLCERGLACVRCNLAIGLLGDDPARLRRIAASLELARSRVTLRFEGMDPELRIP